ncbi:hypothetical protein [Pedobacter sp.]
MLKINCSKSMGLLIALTLLFGAGKTKAQTDLAAGDLLFTGYDAQPGITTTGPRFDRISFVALKRITVGTVLYFTDRGYKGGWFAANANTEGSMSLTTTAVVEAGKEVVLTLTPGFYAATVDGSSIGTPAAVSPRLSMGNTGDQFFIFQKGGGEPDGVGAVMIAGLHWNTVQSGSFVLITSSADWDNLNMVGHPSSTLSTTNSNIPPGLVAGESAFFIGAHYTGSSYINYESANFNGAGKPYANAAAIRSAVMNVANWTRVPSGNGTAVTVPTGHFTTVLPVTLHSFSAKFNAGSLKLDWRTLSESNCDRFVVETSNDGRSWTALATVKSKATDGNSATALDYSLAIPIAGTALAGFGIFGLLLLPAVRKRWMKVGLMIFAVCIVAACAKQEVNGEGLEKLDGAKAQVYVRLAQIDKDGKVNYSETVLAKN